MAVHSIVPIPFHSGTAARKKQTILVRLSSPINAFRHCNCIWWEVTKILHTLVTISYTPIIRRRNKLDKTK